MISGRLGAFASKEIIDEYLRVFAYPQFNLSEQEIEYLIYAEILPYFDVVSLEPGSVIVEKDPSDDIFIQCALASGSRIIISGDRHLLALKKYGRIEILSATQLLKRFG